MHFSGNEPIKGWIIQHPDTSNAHHNEKRHLIALRLLEEAEKFNISLEWKNSFEVWDAIVNANGFNFLPEFAAIWCKDIKLVCMLEHLGVKCFNSAQAIAICDDKALTYLQLQNNGIPQPETIMVPLAYEAIDWSKVRVIDTAIEKLSFPLILKKCRGSFGDGVHLVSDKDTLVELLARYSDEATDVILQKFVKESSGRDIRVQVIDGRAISAMERTSANSDEFRANLTNGGHGRKINMTEDMVEIAISAARACQCDIAGVDLLFSDEGFQVCEVNSNAHFVNLENITGDNIAYSILEMISKRF